MKRYVSLDTGADKNWKERKHNSGFDLQRFGRGVGCLEGEQAKGPQNGDRGEQVSGKAFSIERLSQRGRRTRKKGQDWKKKTKVRRGGFRTDRTLTEKEGRKEEVGGRKTAFTPVASSYSSGNGGGRKGPAIYWRVMRGPERAKEG